MECRCTICHDLVDPMNIAALKCGHTFHKVCISGWLNLRKYCPTCRKSTEQDGVVPQLFFDLGEDTLTDDEDPTTPKLFHMLNKKIRLLEEKASQIAYDHRKVIEAKEAELASANELINRLKGQNCKLLTSRNLLRFQMQRNKRNFGTSRGNQNQSQFKSRLDKTNGGKRYAVSFSEPSNGHGHPLMPAAVRDVRTLNASGQSRIPVLRFGVLARCSMAKRSTAGASSMQNANGCAAGEKPFPKKAKAAVARNQ